MAYSHYLSAKTSKGLVPRDQLRTIQAESIAARKPRAIPVPIGQKGCKKKRDTRVQVIQLLKEGSIPASQWPIIFSPCWYNSCKSVSAHPHPWTPRRTPHHHCLFTSASMYHLVILCRLRYSPPGGCPQPKLLVTGVRSVPVPRRHFQRHTCR